LQLKTLVKNNQKPYKTQRHASGSIGLATAGKRLKRGLPEIRVFFVLYVLFTVLLKIDTAAIENVQSYIVHVWQKDIHMPEKHMSVFKVWVESSTGLDWKRAPAGLKSTSF
jgi:hypothetical protein